jgi:hypothetical protein
MHEVKGDSGNSQQRYETQDVTIRPMVWSAIGLAALMIVGMLASWLAFRYFVRVQKLGPPASPFENSRELPPAPRLQVNPVETLKDYQAEEGLKLNSYGWVDKKAGVVRIPIDLAMQISLERGFPARESSQPDQNQAVARRSIAAAPKKAATSASAGTQ